MLEETRARAVSAQLRAEGRSVTSFGRVPQGRGPSPDFLVTIDGALVALEVKRFIDERAAKAEAGVEMLEKALKRPVARVWPHSVPPCGLMSRLFG